MSERDLSDFLGSILVYDSVTDWVKSVFNEKADYSFQALKQKIKDEEISEHQIEYIAK